MQEDLEEERVGQEEHMMKTKLTNSTTPVKNNWKKEGK